MLAGRTVAGTVVDTVAGDTVSAVVAAAAVVVAAVNKIGVVVDTSLFSFSFFFFLFSFLGIEKKKITISSIFDLFIYKKMFVYFFGFLKNNNFGRKNENLKMTREYPRYDFKARPRENEKKNNSK